MKKIAIFASGSGTNAENIIRRLADNSQAEVSVVVSNRANAYALERARRLGVPTLVFPKEEWRSGENVLAAMQEHGIDLIVLAGFLAFVPSALTDAYPDRILNIHPSLLPKYGGKGMHGDHVHEAVIANNERESGITIHYVNEELDGGAPVAQFKCPVLEGDTAETLAERVHALEYEHFPEVILEVLGVQG